MPALPAIRQLVFLAADLDSTLTSARRELGLGPGVKDEEGMAELGFIHEVLTIDQTFLEFSAPLSAETMPGRLVAKRGDLGYMVVVQVADIEALKERAASLDLTPVFQTPYEGHTITQWHPRDFGTLAEFDQIRPPETWHMAPRIFEHGSTDVVGDIAAIEVAVPEPAAMAARWSSVLDIAPGPDPQAIDLSAAQLRFVSMIDDRVGLITVELPAADRRAVGRITRISGVDFRFV